MDSYARLDSKDNPTHEPPTGNDVLDVLEVININPDVKELMITGFKAVGPLLMTSVQMLAVNCLLHNVPHFAQETVHSTATEEFKAEPTKQTMMDYLFNAILMKRRPVDRRQSMFNHTWLADRDALPHPSSCVNSWRQGQQPPENEQEQSPPAAPDLGSVRAPCPTLAAVNVSYWFFVA